MTPIDPIPANEHAYDGLGSSGLGLAQNNSSVAIPHITKPSVRHFLLGLAGRSLAVVGRSVAIFNDCSVACGSKWHGSVGTTTRSWSRVAGDLRRVVRGPDGSRYEVIGAAKDWKLGTGSVLLDAAASVWAAVRQARGKEWVVLVRRIDSGTNTVTRRVARTRDDAASTVAELAEAIEPGEFAPPAE